MESFEKQVHYVQSLINSSKKIETLSISLQVPPKGTSLRSLVRIYETLNLSLPVLESLALCFYRPADYNRAHGIEVPENSLSGEDLGFIGMHVSKCVKLKMLKVSVPSGQGTTAESIDQFDSILQINTVKNFSTLVAH